MSNQQTPSQWTPPFHGVTHLGKLRDPRSATVTIFASGAAMLAKWYSGCGFSPKQEFVGTEIEAKLAGEAWKEEAR